MAFLLIPRRPADSLEPFRLGQLRRRVESPLPRTVNPRWWNQTQLMSKVKHTFYTHTRGFQKIHPNAKKKMKLLWRRKKYFLLDNKNIMEFVFLNAARANWPNCKVTIIHNIHFNQFPSLRPLSILLNTNCCWKTGPLCGRDGPNLLFLPQSGVTCRDFMTIQLWIVKCIITSVKYQYKH